MHYLQYYNILYVYFIYAHTIAGKDFEDISSQITVSPETTTVPINVTIYNNFDNLSTKNFTLVLRSEEASARIITGTTVVYIFDDDCKTIHYVYV